MPHSNQLGVCAQAVVPSKISTADFRDRARTASDLHMMIQHDGMERNAQQWEHILSRAGFALTRIVSTRSIFSIVEAGPLPALAASGLQHPAESAV